MPETAPYSHLARRPRLGTLRMIMWIDEPYFQGFGCSECAWAFNPSGPPVGNSLQEMKEDFARRRDNEFAAHVCAEHPTAKMTKIQTSHTEPLRMARLQRGASTK